MNKVAKNELVDIKFDENPGLTNDDGDNVDDSYDEDEEDDWNEDDNSSEVESENEEDLVSIILNL